MSDIKHGIRYARLCNGPEGEACGVDLREAISQYVPIDGEVHEYQCPSCGMDHHATRVREDHD